MGAKFLPGMRSEDGIMIEVIEDGTKKRYVMQCKWCNTKFSFTYDDTYQGITVNMVTCPVCKESVLVDYSDEVPDESNKNDR